MVEINKYKLFCTAGMSEEERLMAVPMQFDRERYVNNVNPSDVAKIKGKVSIKNAKQRSKNLRTKA